MITATRTYWLGKRQSSPQRSPQCIHQLYFVHYTNICTKISMWLKTLHSLLHKLFTYSEKTFWNIKVHSQDKKVWDTCSKYAATFWSPYETPYLKNKTHTHPLNGPLSGTTRVDRYQNGKINLDFTEARDSEWQLHQLGHMQVCTPFQTDNHASTSPLSFYRQDALPAAQPTASKHWRQFI